MHALSAFRTTKIVSICPANTTQLASDAAKTYGIVQFAEIKSKILLEYISLDEIAIFYD